LNGTIWSAAPPPPPPLALWEPKIPPTDQPNDSPILELVKRGQKEGVFDTQLGAEWIEHALFGLIQKGCEDAATGDLPRHAVAPTIIRTFERGICAPSE
jgi:hypothetical protein